MLQQWIEISKKSPKFVDGECDKLWCNMDQLSGGLTVHSLHYWARQDNLYKYNRICKKSVDTELPNILNVKDGKVPSYDLAKIVKLCFSDIFACVSKKILGMLLKITVGKKVTRVVNYVIYHPNKYEQ